MNKVEKLVLKHGFTLSTARWLDELAKELGVGEKALFRSVVKLARQGVWLEAEDWRYVAQFVDLSRHLDIVVDYIVRRVRSGATVPDVVKEIPKAVEKAGKLTHIREVLSNLL